MKYSNQINTVLAAAGVIVVLYALTQTFLSPVEVAQTDPSLLPTSVPAKAAPDVSESPGAQNFLRGSSTTRTAPGYVSPGISTQRPAGGGEGRSQPPNIFQIPASQSEMERGGDEPANPGSAPSRSGGNLRRNPAPRAADPQPAYPPAIRPGSDPEKRVPLQDEPRLPPVRSSAPDQRPPR